MVNLLSTKYCVLSHLSLKKIVKKFPFGCVSQRDKAVDCSCNIYFSQYLLLFLSRSLRYCDLRLINSSSLVRTSLEQELGLAAYFVSSEIHTEKPVVNDVLESDPEKLSSTDNEDEEIATEGIFYY